MMLRVFTKKGCGTCNSVKMILRQRQLPFEEIDVSTEAGQELAYRLGITHSGAIIDEDDNEVTIDRIPQIAIAYHAATA